MYRALILGICLLPSLAAASIDCESCEAWNADQAPFQIFGNTYYVGVRGLSSVLITSPDGHILIDGALPQSAPLIAHHVEQLGFKMSDVKIILNSHVHYDHAGGIAELQKLSGAKVIASWTWTSCESDRCLNVVYGDSLNAISDDSFKYSSDKRYPNASSDMAASIAAIGGYPRRGASGLHWPADSHRPAGQRRPHPAHRFLSVHALCRRG